MPKLQLVGVKRSMIARGKKVSQNFTITGAQLQVWHEVQKFIYQPGTGNNIIHEYKYQQIFLAIFVDYLIFFN